MSEWMCKWANKWVYEQVSELVSVWACEQKNGMNDMSGKNGNDDKYDKILFKMTQIFPRLSLLTIFC